MKWITPLALSVCLAISCFAKPPLPRAADDFRILDSSGKPLQLSAYRGKVVLVQFLYTTCPHCQATARMLSNLQKDWGPRGLQVVGVAFNPEIQKQPALVDEFVKTNQISFPIGVASPEAVLKYLGISVMERFVVPQMMIIDRAGTVRAQSDLLGSPELQDASYLRTFLGDLLNKRRQPATTASEVK